MAMKFVAVTSLLIVLGLADGKIEKLLVRLTIVSVIVIFDSSHGLIFSD